MQHHRFFGVVLMLDCRYHDIWDKNISLMNRVFQGGGGRVRVGRWGGVGGGIRDRSWFCDHSI